MEAAAAAAAAAAVAATSGLTGGCGDVEDDSDEVEADEEDIGFSSRIVIRTGWSSQKICRRNDARRYEKTIYLGRIALKSVGSCVRSTV